MTTRRKRPPSYEPKRLYAHAHHVGDLWSLPDGLDALSLPDRAAVLLTFFDSQIRRNGIQFWITNGFSESNDDLAALLDDLAAAGLDVGDPRSFLRAVVQVEALADAIDALCGVVSDDALNHLEGTCQALQDGYEFIRAPFFKELEQKYYPAHTRRKPAS